MKHLCSLALILVIFSCKKSTTDLNNSTSETDTTSIIDDVAGTLEDEPVVLTLEQANNLANLPLSCVNTEYPNKLGQTLASKADIAQPNELHPAFYGCFDWHSSVHAHWSMVSLLKQFPDLKKAEAIKETLQSNLSKENIIAEVEYFKKEHNKSYERTYGWAWVLKLSEELHTWESPMARELEENLKPLTNLIIERYKEFLPKLNYPIRVGEHTNSAFGISFALDYAKATENEEFAKLLKVRSKDFYLNDNSCPITWEPSGYDFLSPCLEEIDVMRRVLPKEAFLLWMQDFMPQLLNKDFTLAVGEVSDRKDGKLVHLDGLNFSRAWVLYGLAKQYPQKFGHLRALANQHVNHSYPNLVGDSYEGGHWLGSFALYALNTSKME